MAKKKIKQKEKGTSQLASKPNKYQKKQQKYFEVNTVNH